MISSFKLTSQSHDVRHKDAWIISIKFLLATAIKLIIFDPFPDCRFLMWKPHKVLVGMVTLNLGTFPSFLNLLCSVCSKPVFPGAIRIQHYVCNSRIFRNSTKPGSLLSKNQTRWPKVESKIWGQTDAGGGGVEP